MTQDKMEIVRLHMRDNYDVAPWEWDNKELEIAIYDLMTKNQANNNEVLDLVSGCLICIMDNVEGEGLTKGMGYKILAEKEGMYCIVDDNNNLGVYGEIFFDKE